jgi:hypothetical protein
VLGHMPRMIPGPGKAEVNDDLIVPMRQPIEHPIKGPDRLQRIAACGMVFPPLVTLLLLGGHCCHLSRMSKQAPLRARLVGVPTVGAPPLRPPKVHLKKNAGKLFYV